MEVILREHVDNLGRRGEIVKVADGYARNYLLPRKLALLATDGNKKQVERERAKFDDKEPRSRRSAQAVADRLATVEVVISRKVGETEALYGSVTSSRHRRRARRQGLRARSPQAAARRADQADRRVRRAGEAAPRRHGRPQGPGRGRRRGRRENVAVSSSNVGKSEVRSQETRDLAESNARVSVSTVPLSFDLGSKSTTFYPLASRSRCPKPPSPNARFRTTSRPNARCSARSCCTTTRSTSPPR